MNRNLFRHLEMVARFVVLACLALSLAACSTTSQGRKTTTSGFLPDYSQLHPGEEGEAQLIYINSDKTLGAYTKIQMDPITVYAGEDCDLEKIPEDELKGILDYFDAAVREQLKGDYTFVSNPGPDTMRLRIALTEAKGANVLLNTASSVSPAGIALSGLKKAVTGKSTGVGQARAEMELLDASTGRRLAAAVDERVGSKGSSFKKWDGVKSAIDYWAERLRIRLVEMRSQ